MNNKFKLLAESLAEFLAPTGQVALCDQNDKPICLFNQLTAEPTPSLEPYQQRQIELKKNRTAKAIKLPLDDQHSLQIMIDTSALSNLQSFLNQYLQQEARPTAISHWHEQVEHLLQQYLKENNVSVNALTASNKRELIQLFNENGIFKYQDSANYLANKLKVSRATIYNYLSQSIQLNSIFVHQVDSFTDEPFSGNPAGVVLDADALDVSLMKKIAREMNLSETSFVFKSKKADIKLRYFTPTGDEVKFCGHSTVGALYMLAHEKRLGINKPGRYPLSIETLVGIIPAEINLEENNRIEIQFQTPKIDLALTKITPHQIANALGINIKHIDTQQPIMIEKTNQDIFVTIKSLEDLGQLQVDHKSAKRFAEKNKLVAYCLLCSEAFSKNNQLHMRCFAPAVGIDEDPFTGSVLGGLAAYVLKNKIIDPKAKDMRVEQGHFMNRAGYVEVKFNKERGELSPLIIAKARHFFSTEIKL